MTRHSSSWRRLGLWLANCSMLCNLVGCHSKQEVRFEPVAHFQPAQTQIEYPDTCVEPASAIGEAAAEPRSVREPGPEDMWPLTLEEVIDIALQNSTVMRELGARVLVGPQSMRTVYDPALQMTDPRSGEEAALSDFDAQLSSRLFMGRDERAFNNAFFAGGAPTNQATAAASVTGGLITEVSKTAATGTQFAIRNENLRNSNSIAGAKPPFDLFPSTYDSLIAAEFRHPLLQGGGLQFNRIAGPNGRPGFYNGVLLARMRTDIALADFEVSVRDFLGDIQSTYWQLYFAYRNLDARVAARDAALESWRLAKVKLETGAGSELEEALAHEQYEAFQAEVSNALNGVGTSTSTALARVGVYATERQLRLLMGIDVNDQRIIRPAEEPSRAEILFDWDESVDQAMFRRVELRRQHWTVKQREYELLAARNLKLVRLDLVGGYRWRGFGDDLFGQRDRNNGSAYRDMFTGDLQGWNSGLQLSTPIGNRIGHLAARNAELQLSRERALLREQERYTFAQLSDATAELARSYDQSRIQFNRTVAARRRLKAEQARYDLGDGELVFVLQAQSRVADADSEFFRALVDYNLAVARVHIARGTFLDYLGVSLTEGPWSDTAYRAATKQSRRFTPRTLNYCVTRPNAVSRGPFEQHVLPHDSDAAEGEPTPAGRPAPASDVVPDEPSALPEPAAAEDDRETDGQRRSSSSIPDQEASGTPRAEEEPPLPTSPIAPEPAGEAIRRTPSTRGIDS